MLHDYFNRLIVFDIETASECETLDHLHDEKGPHKVDLWKKRCTWLRNRYPENANMTDSELYVEKAALHPEFSKIICISIAQIKGDGESVVIKSYSGHTEKEILTDFLKLNSNILSKIPGATYCGHNIKRFDVPFIAKRLIINGLPIPHNFQMFKMKSWEIPFLDTGDIWSFGAWQEGFTSLDLICECLDVPTPKDKMDGKDVGKAYYGGKLSEIVEYCEKDVEATCRVILKLSNISTNPTVDKK
jgi:predicted PolB exonuclease-like 3'-5' exonuclease